MGLFNVWDTEFHLNFLTGIKNAEVGKVKLYGEVLGEKYCLRILGISY